MIFRLKGKGVKKLRSTEVGDMMVEVQVEMPTNLTSDQEKLLTAFTSSLDQVRNQPEVMAFEEKATKYLKPKK